MSDYSIHVRRNWCDAEGAMELAQELRSYWLRRGGAVVTKIVQVVRSETDKRNTVHCVRSDMIGGLPRGWSSARGWQQIGDVAQRVVNQCGEDVRTHAIKMQAELNRMKGDSND